MFSNIGDSELIYLIRSENYYAKEYFIERYKKRIYGMINAFATKNCINKLDYEECYQDCFIVFLKCLNGFDNEHNFYSYLSNAIYRRLKTLYSKKRLDDKVLSLDRIFTEMGKDVIVRSIPLTNIVYKDAKEFKDEINNILSILVVKNPDDSFYYQR